MLRLYSALGQDFAHILHEQVLFGPSAGRLTPIEAQWADYFSEPPKQFSSQHWAVYFAQVIRHLRSHNLHEMKL